MKPTSILTAALTCAALLSLTSGSAIAQPSPDKPFPAELKVTMYEHPKLVQGEWDDDEWDERVDYLCTLATSGNTAELERFLDEPENKGKVLPLLTRTNCGSRSPVRSLFSPANIEKETVWQRVAETYGTEVLNAPDPVDQLNVLDYLLEQEKLLEAKPTLNSAEESLLKAVKRYIPQLKKMGAVHSKYYLWKQGKSTP